MKVYAYIAKDNTSNEAKGFGIVRELHGQDKTYTICNIGTEQSYQKNGVGSNMIAVMTQKAHDKGAKTISIDVDTGSEQSRKFHEKFGFEVTSENTQLGQVTMQAQVETIRKSLRAKGIDPKQSIEQSSSR